MFNLLTEQISKIKNTETSAVMVDVSYNKQFVGSFSVLTHTDFFDLINHFFIATDVYKQYETIDVYINLSKKDSTLYVSFLFGEESVLFQIKEKDSIEYVLRIIKAYYSDYMKRYNFNFHYTDTYYENVKSNKTLLQEKVNSVKFVFAFKALGDIDDTLNFFNRIGKERISIQDFKTASKTFFEILVQRDAIDAKRFDSVIDKIVSQNKGDDILQSRFLDKARGIKKSVSKIVNVTNVIDFLHKDYKNTKPDITKVYTTFEANLQWVGAICQSVYDTLHNPSNKPMDKNVVAESIKITMFLMYFYDIMHESFK